MGISAHDVASALRARRPGLGDVKLHKLLYYCQAHHLAAFGAPLFTESISAWDMGPVVGQLWYAEKNGEPPAVASDLDEAQLNTIGYVLSRYGAMSSLDLKHTTHAEMPWQRANAGRDLGGSALIEHGWILEYFASVEPQDEEDRPGLDSTEVRRWLAGAAERRAAEPRPDDTNELRARLRSA